MLQILVAKYVEITLKNHSGYRQSIELLLVVVDSLWRCSYLALSMR